MKLSEAFEAQQDAAAEEAAHLDRGKRERDELRFSNPVEYYNYASARDIGDTIRYDKNQQNMSYEERKGNDRFTIVDIGMDYILAVGTQDRYSSDVLLVMKSNMYHLEFRPFTVWIEDYTGKMVLLAAFDKVSTQNLPAMASMARYMIKSGVMTFMTFRAIQMNYWETPVAIESMVRNFSAVYDEYQRNNPGFGTDHDVKQMKEFKRFWNEVPDNLKTDDAKSVYHELLKLTGVKHKKLDKKLKQQDDLVPEKSNRKHKKVKASHRWDKKL